MAVASKRDVESLSGALLAWFATHRRDWSAVSIDIDRPQPGMSSETLFLDVSHDGTHEAFVLRLPSEAGGLFPDYDLAAQARVQRAVAQAGLAVPECTYEPSAEVLGAPFVLMPKVAGRTLTTNPPYIRKGWLHDADAADQQRLQRSFIATMARINRLDPAEVGLTELSGGGPTLTGAVAWWRDYVAWATTHDEWAAPYLAALDWLDSHRPVDVPAPAVLWGDPQLVNLVVGDDWTPAAVLDWEMAALGPPEVDLTWFLTLHGMSVEQAGADLPGFLPRAEIIRLYESELGRPVADLQWYEVFAHVRSGAIVLRAGQLMHEAARDPSWMINAPQLQHLAKLTA